MANQKQLSNLMLLLRGGVGNAANARQQGPYQNERSMFASKVMTPKPMTAPDHRAVPPTTPLPAYRPAQGGGGGGGKPRIPVPLPRPADRDPYPGAANQPDPYRNFPLPTHDIPQSLVGQDRFNTGGPGGGTPTGQPASGYGPGGGTRTGMPPYQNVMPNAENFGGLPNPRPDIPTTTPAGQPPIPGLGRNYGHMPPPPGEPPVPQGYAGQERRPNLIQQSYAGQDRDLRLGPPGGPGGGGRTGQEFSSVETLPGAGGDGAPGYWWQPHRPASGVQFPPRPPFRYHPQTGPGLETAMFGQPKDYGAPPPRPQGDEGLLAPGGGGGLLAEIMRALRGQ